MKNHGCNFAISHFSPSINANNHGDCTRKSSAASTTTSVYESALSSNSLPPMSPPSLSASSPSYYATPMESR